MATASFTFSTIKLTAIKGTLNMKFGLRYCNTGQYTDPDKAVELLQAAEEAGFESAWTVEHTVLPENYESPYPYSTDGKTGGGRNDIPLPDPLIWLAYVAAQTSTIKLGTGILILPQHNPVMAAKQIATLDVMARGRVLLGIGAGWLKEEFDVLGVEFAARGARMEEYVAVLRALWSEETPSFNGDFTRFAPVYCRPQPVNGNVPVIVGGHSKAAARRAGRIGDGFFPARGVSEELIALARSSAIDVGRDPDALEITASLPETVDDIPHLAKLGVDRILVPVTPTPGMGSWVKNPDDALKWRDQIDQHRE